ncbi:hypothetical protein I6A60_26670 [Frankia sp. AgB1.9]|nr:hypothetical protein [Frankia sp. AgW1.1]MBL7551417.1 hypothetical protein [Frankia sp. AgB1.9]MBL7622669.1 hypothetical protein [Frankia sp. AgB1.8]
MTPEFVLAAYHRLYNIEKAFRMSNSDLPRGRSTTTKAPRSTPHLTIVFAALAVTRFIEDRPGWSVRRFVRTTRRYRTIQIRAGEQRFTAEDPLPDDLRTALALIV